MAEPEKIQFSEIDLLQEENRRLRAALAVSKDPCVYCQLPFAEMARCRSGFPGCGRADDMTGCPELSAAVELSIISEELDKVKMERDGYRKSYELMQKDMESQSELMDGLKQEVRAQANEIKKLKEENVQWELLVRNAPCPPEKHHEDN